MEGGGRIGHLKPLKAYETTFLIHFPIRKSAL